VNDKASALPLRDLFDTLREAGLPLGVDDYLALLEALRGGFGLPDREGLRRLCRTLWVKSPEDALRFEHHFARIFAVSPSVTAPQSQMPYQSRRENAEHAAGAPQAIRNPSPSEQIISIQLPAQPANVWRAGLVPDYLPISQRQMKQSWRRLNRATRRGAATELDLAETIRQLSLTGNAVEPVLVPPRVNRTELLLLVDRGGSMEPFEPLSERLIETALRGGRLGSIQVFSFHNCPEGYLYTDRFRQSAEPLLRVLDTARQRQAGMLIVSDAGAARGGTNQARITQTELFLAEVRRAVRYVAWLNPMPTQRWKGTSAAEIGRLVPMFPCTRRGLDAAVGVLRGRFEAVGG